MPSRGINDVVDELGFGAAQIRLICLGGGIYVVSGTVLTLFGTLPAVIAVELGLHPYQRAFLFVSSVIGTLIGNVSNAVSDTYLGRRTPILLGYAIGLLSAVMISFLHSFGPMVACWMLAGFGFGFGGTAWNSLSSENSPSNKRMLMNGCSLALFSVASFFVFMAEFSYSSDLKLGPHWRELMLWVQIPGALLFVTATIVGFPDSAHVCLAQGDVEGARDVLRALQRQNGRPDVSIQFDQGVLTSKQELGPLSSLRTVFSRQLRSTTFAVCWSTFVLNFVGYGGAYAIPIVLSSLRLSWISPALILCVGPLSELTGYAFGISASNRMARRSQIMVYLTCATICNVLICVGFFRLELNPNDTTGQACVLLVAMTLQLVCGPGWLAVYVYASEVFPTICRSFGTGFVLGSGRIGSISAPLVFETLHMATGAHLSFFALVSVFMVVNVLLVLFVLPETKGRPLKEGLDEEEPLLKKAASCEANFPPTSQTPTSSPALKGAGPSSWL